MFNLIRLAMRIYDQAINRQNSPEPSRPKPRMPFRRYNSCSILQNLPTKQNPVDSVSVLLELGPLSSSDSNLFKKPYPVKKNSKTPFVFKKPDKNKTPILLFQKKTDTKPINEVKLKKLKKLIKPIEPIKEYYYFPPTKTPEFVVEETIISEAPIQSNPDLHSDKLTTEMDYDSGDETKIGKEYCISSNSEVMINN
ncbi:hypothetical protein HUG17_0139 [Dermatophagoides farinae]|uniref:Uncharacterized protein n=1 Tax=Dermatophagoides farinae TaxID=6954 RepID=A0A9D4SKG1_DERFA|nr:uncharacterized protein LOC124494372 [Dermatophagoides farinae]KAH7644601.1 hypothetical protein HUG17_0139 [Dermatophagoides farinae]